MLTVTNTAVLPSNETQKCVALAIAEVIKKSQAGTRLAEFPYATAFFRHFFETTTPSRLQLTSICHSPDMTIPAIKAELDAFIDSNGNAYTNLCSSFKEAAFPCLVGLDRFDARYDLKSAQKGNVERKLKIKQQSKADELKSQMMALPPAELPAWVRETEEHLSSHEQLSMLSDWHKEKANDDLPFHDLFIGMGAMEVALDLSYI